MFDINTYFTDGEIIAIVLFLIGLQSFILYFAFEGVKARLREINDATNTIRKILGGVK